MQMKDRDSTSLDKDFAGSGVNNKLLMPISVPCYSSLYAFYLSTKS